MCRILLAVDGGINSAVAGCLLKVQGYDVVGVHVRIWDQDEKHQTYPKSNFNCAGIENEERLAALCKKIEIPLKVVSASDKFQKEVIETYLHTRINSRKPSSCRLCMKNVIIKTLIEQMDRFEAESIAFGHFARVSYNQFEKHYSIWQSKNIKNDSSRFFFDLSQEELSKLVFPVGDLNGKELNTLANKFELADLVKPSNRSKEMPCFLKRGSDKEFIESRIPESMAIIYAGLIVDKDFNYIAKHEGLHNYLIGEKISGKPIHKVYKYVLDVNPRNNTIIMGEKSDLQTSRFLVKRLNLINLPKLAKKRDYIVANMEGQSAPCTLTVAQDRKLVVQLSSRSPYFWIDKEVAFFDNNLLLGGGVIERVLG